MKYFSMSDNLDKQMLERFIPFYNENQSENVGIIMNTQGGSAYVTETMIRMINEMPNAVILIQAAYSAGLYLSIHTTCKKLLSTVAKGMYHYGRVEVNVNTKGEPYYYEDECQISNLSIDHRRDHTLAKKIMTAKEYINFKEGKEVYFDAKRMRQIFPEAKLI